MPQFSLGQEVRIPCEVSPGPFSEQKIVTFETVNGPVSGFVDAEDVISEASGNTYIAGVVEAVRSDTVEVRVKGSFFTTNGLAVVQRAMVAAA